MTSASSINAVMRIVHGSRATLPSRPCLQSLAPACIGGNGTILRGGRRTFAAECFFARLIELLVRSRIFTLGYSHDHTPWLIRRSVACTERAFSFLTCGNAQMHPEFQATLGFQAFSREQAVSLGTILLIVLVLILVGVIPTWPHSRGWGYRPTGIVGAILIVLLILLLAGRI